MKFTKLNLNSTIEIEAKIFLFSLMIFIMMVGMLKKIFLVFCCFWSFSSGQVCHKNDCYLVEDEAKSFVEAVEKCYSYGGTLASFVRDSEREDVVGRPILIFIQFSRI